MGHQAVRLEWAHESGCVERGVAGDGESGCGDLALDGGGYEAGAGAEKRRR